MEHEKRQFEQDVSPEEQQLDGLLFDAMKVTPPTGLASRITTASMGSLLEGQLDGALSFHIPEGLSERVFAASVSSLHEAPEVIGRVGHTVLWRQVAMAACVVFAVLVAIRFGVQPIERNMVAITNSEVLSVEEEGLLLEDLDLMEFDYLAGTRELAFADVAESMNSLRNDLELWQYGLLTE
jgi:hypothetical protein